MEPVGRDGAGSRTTQGRTAVLVPALNEEATVAAVIRQIADIGLQVIVINDGSSDRTSAVARRTGAQVLDLPLNLGVGGALRCGFRWAVEEGYDVVVQCDADGQHDPLQLQALIDGVRIGGAHLAIGTRFTNAGGFEATRVRRIAIRVLGRIASKATRTTITDPSSGFRAIREPLLSEFAREYPSQYLGDTFGALVQAGRAGYTVREVPVLMRERAGGRPSAGSVASIRFLARALLTLVLGADQRYPPAHRPERRLYMTAVETWAKPLQITVLLIASIGLSGVVLTVARRGRLSMRYTIGWLFVAVCLAIGGLLSGFITPVAESLDVTPAALIAGIASVSLLAITVQLSISVSGVTESNRALAEALALSEARRTYGSQKVSDDGDPPSAVARPEPDADAPNS